MITNKLTLLVFVILLLRYADSLTCHAPIIRLGHCHDGLQARVKTEFVVENRMCRNKTSVSYVHCQPIKHIEFCKCSAIGDPHYRTYDGQTIHYFGDCKYLLTQYWKKNDHCAFKVIVQNERKGNHSKLTCTKAVEIHMLGSVFVIGQGRGLKVDNKHQNIPYEKGLEVRIFYSGKLLQFVAPRCGVNVAFNGDCNLYVEVSRRYGGKMQGLCGNCDGSQNDFKTSSGQDVSNHPNKFNLIGDSYAIPNKKRPCSPAPIFNLKNICKGEWRTKISELSQCGSLLAKSGPFTQCASSTKVAMRDFFDDCRIDVCLNGNNVQKREKARCKILEAVAEICAEAGYPGIHWRSKLNCSFKCHANQHFTTKATPCPRTCENHFYGTKDPCYHLPEREGCECNVGYLRDGASCVKPSHCTCVDVCTDRENEKSCLGWKKQGKCHKFEEQMKLICKKTCGFCKTKSNQCKDELNTWKCIQFRDEGKCVESFYKTICGLTCNYEMCACSKDKKIVGPCDRVERKQTITYHHFTRDSYGNCIKRVTQRSRVCDCPFIYRSRRGQCNFCLGRINVTIFTQKKKYNKCIRRTIHTFIRCSNCPSDTRHFRTCLHNSLIIATTLFNRRKGCFSCIPVKTGVMHNVLCRKSVLRGRCNPRTCLKTFSYIIRKPSNCKCLDRRFERSVLCCCKWKDRDLKPFCCNGKIVHRRVKFRFQHGICRSHFTDRIETPVCKRPRKIRGHCQRYRLRHLYCIAEDKSYSAVVNSKCQCVIKYNKRYRTCCCKGPESYTNCEKHTGVIETVQNIYRLEHRGGHHYCQKNVKRTTKTICFSTQYIRREGKCLSNCHRTDTIIKKYRDGCSIKEVFERTETKLCCCLPGHVSKYRCVANYIVVVKDYRRMLVGRQCMNILVSSRRRIINCPAPTIVRGRCIYPGYKRLVITIFYRTVKCRCVRKQKRDKEQCKPCPYNLSKKITTPCNTRTCLQKVITYYQDVDCRYKVRRCNQLCCCKEKPSHHEYCDRDTGMKYTINHRYEFIRQTKTCCKKSHKVSNSVACILLVRIKTGKCGAIRKHYKKRTLKRYVLDKSSCSCRPVVKVKWVICACDSPKYSKWLCTRGYYIREVTTSAINVKRNRCDIGKFKEIKSVRCLRPRPNKVVSLSRCKYAVYRFFYRIIRCKCVMKRTRTVYYKCCRRHQIVRKCVKNVIVRTVIVFKVSANRRTCIAVASIYRSRASCRPYFRRHRTPCIKGKYFDVTVYYGTRKCKCVKIRVQKIPIICECFPKAPIIKKTCLGNRWLTTITSIKLVNRRCIPCSKYSETFIPCPPPFAKRGPCNHKTGLITIRSVYYTWTHCKCVRHIKYYHIKCPCWRPDTIIRPWCVSNVREVQRMRYKDVNGHCKWVRIESEIEHCKCKRRTSVTMCYKLLVLRTTSTFYDLVLVNLKIPVRRCRKRITEKFHSVVCNKNYKYTTPCKNFRQSIISCSYSRVNCKCREHCRLDYVQACNCRQRNYCEFKCIRNSKYKICHRFTERKHHCIDNKSTVMIPLQCSPPFVPIICSKCTIYRHHGFYRKCTRYFAVLENCQCKIRQVTDVVLCHCKNKWVSRPVCRRNHYLISTIYYVRRHGLCVPKTTAFIRRIYCSRPFITIRNLRCTTEYRETYYIKWRCQCQRRYRFKSNSKCCHRPIINKYCKKDHWVYVESRLVQRSTRIRLFPRLFNSPYATYCQRVKRKWTRSVRCPISYVISCCNTATLQMKIDTYTFHNINCLCVLKVTTRYESCRKCPKKVVRKSKCHPPDSNGYGYMDITVTFYKVTKKNHCKKFVRHKRKLCSCPKSQKKTYCLKGEIITKTFTYRQTRYSLCNLHVSFTSKSVFCYNRGRPNPWILVNVKRCRRPGHYTIDFYVRYVFDKAKCGCHLVKRTVKSEICCRHCFVQQKCIRNVIIHTTICERPRGLKCVVFKKSSVVHIRCSRPIKRLIGKCVKGIQKYSLTTYHNVRCKCRRKVVNRRERCQCFPKETRVCVGTRWKITAHQYLLRKGRCLPIIKTYYADVYCRRIISFRDYKISKCKFWRHIFTTRVKNCRCVPHYLYKRKLYKCCKKAKTEVKCKSNRILVRTTNYFVRIQFHCFRRRLITESPIVCPYIPLVKYVKISRCRLKFIYYKLVYKNCKCRRKKVREIIKKICCRKPYSKTVCDARKGLIITYHYTYYLGRDGKCHVKVMTRKVGVSCNRKNCHYVIGKCVNNTKTVKVYCVRRVHCKCVRKLVHQGYECCKRDNFQWKVIGPCIDYFKAVTYFSYRLNKKLNLCRAVVIRRQKRRCDCPRGYQIKSCLNDIYKKTVIVTYRLNKIRDTCIETKDEHISVLNGCSKKKRSLGIVHRTCDRHTGRGTETSEFIYAKGCACKTIKRTKPTICICHKAYPPKVRTYCKYDKVTVRETITAICRGNIAIFTTTILETPITNCNKIDIEKGACFKQNNGNAISVRYVSKIQYSSRNCKCYRKVIESRVEHCKCRKSWTKTRCHRFRIVITISVIVKRHWICQRSVKTIIKNVKCPSRPQVTRTRCRGNRYQIITRSFYHRHCRCISRITVKRCDCSGPRGRVYHVCTRHFTIKTIRIVYVLFKCRVVRRIYVTERSPRCPKFIKQTIGPCIRNGHRGIRTITKRKAVKIPRMCKCKISTFVRSEICWCEEKLKPRKYCYKNNVRVREVWKLVINKRMNRCELVKLRSSIVTIIPPKTVIIYNCNKVTGKETKTTICYRIVNCRIVKQVKVKVYDCICTKEWKLIKQGKCSGTPRCLRVDIYVRQELRRKRCVHVKEIKYVKCCCHPSKKIYKYCKHDRKYTLTITFNLKNEHCYPTQRTTFSVTMCPRKVVVKQTKCYRREYKIISYYRYVVRNCVCSLIISRRVWCRCRCPRTPVEYYCHRMKRIRTKRVTTYSIVNCKCVSKVQKTESLIICPKNRKIVSKCLRVRGQNYCVRTTVIISYRVSGRCACIPRKDVSSKICKCIRNEHRKRSCNAVAHVINERITFTTMVYHSCVTKVQIKRYPVNCGSRRWAIRGDSGCMFNSDYGQRILTYARRVAVGCHCKYETRTAKCHCRCTGPSHKSQCYGTQIKRIHYSYHMIRCKCVRRQRVTWKSIVCRHLNVVKDPCREVSKDVFVEYMIYRERFVSNCRCRRRTRIVGRVCKCARGYTYRRCNKITNQWLHVRIWNVLLSSGCKKQSETITRVTLCDLTPDCRVISRCRKGSQTQRFECTERYRENCQCHSRKVQYVQKCECKPKKIIRGACNKRTGFKNITIIRFNLIVLRNNRKRCIQSRRTIRERCRCLLKPVTTRQCKNNKFLIQTTSYHFNKRTKVCDKTCSTIDKTPECYQTKENPWGKCNRRTCIQHMKIIARTLKNCHCIETKSIKSRECCCKEKDYSVRVCIRGNIYKTTTYTYRFVNNHCEKYSSDTYRRARCPANQIRYSPCQKVTLTQTKEETIYELNNCRCIPRLVFTSLVCDCPQPRTDVKCLVRSGVLETAYTYWVFNSILHQCFRFQRVSQVQISCQTKPQISCSRCTIIFNSGVYQLCNTRYQVRVGCRCHNRAYSIFRLCYCPRPHRFVVCENNVRVTKEIYFVRVPSTNRLRDYICVRRIRILSRQIIDCRKPTISHGPCVNSIRIYTLRYYQLFNCNCVLRIKTFAVKCRCPKPKVISKRCVDDVRKEKNVRHYRLVCDKKSIPTCKCIYFDRVEAVELICRKPQFRVKKCEGGVKKIVAIHYEPRNCKCHKVRYTATTGCDEGCYDMSHCDKIKKLGLCRESIYYRFECQRTCGYCEVCPKDHVDKYVGQCKCKDIHGLRFCTRKTHVTHYTVINRRCTHMTHVYRSICNCLDSSPYKCSRAKLAGKCNERDIMKECELTCNPNCQMSCHGEIRRRRCVQRGVHKGTYKVVVINFKRLGDICLTKMKISYQGRCPVCSRSVRTEVTECIGNRRYVLTYYVIRVKGVCINKVKRTPYSCKDCCPSTETLIGNCIGSSRTVVTVFWANIRNHCMKQTLANIYICNRRCIGITHVNSQCVLNKRMEFKIWKSGASCESHVAQTVANCVPVPT